MKVSLSNSLELMMILTSFRKICLFNQDLFRSTKNCINEDPIFCFWTEHLQKNFAGIIRNYLWWVDPAQKISYAYNSRSRPLLTNFRRGLKILWSWLTSFIFQNKSLLVWRRFWCSFIILLNTFEWNAFQNE